MQTITLISTRHEELGRCTSDALYRIFESIGPEVIFEEIPAKYFDDHYVSKTRRNLEVNTVNRYIENFKVEHVPVDSDDIPGEEFFEDNRRLLKGVEGLADQAGFDYRTLMDKNMGYSAMHGLNYLNSKYSVAYYADIDDAVERLCKN